MIPDYFEAITAYRAFDVHPNGLLVGQAHQEPWPPYQPFVARCGALSGEGWNGHVVDGAFTPAPVFGCDCGIHVLKLAKDANQRVSAERGGWVSLSRGERPAGRAWGSVKVWGRMVEHETGYRAEFAYPHELSCDDPALAATIAALYGVPCAVVDTPAYEPSGNQWVGQFWSSSFISGSSFSYSWSWPSSYIVSVGDDSKDKPQIVTPKPSGSIAPPKLVGANRWQQKQYANHVSPNIKVPDWRAMLRQMVYANPVSA